MYLIYAHLMGLSFCLRFALIFSVTYILLLCCQDFCFEQGLYCGGVGRFAHRTRASLEFSKEARCRSFDRRPLLTAALFK